MISHRSLYQPIRRFPELRRAQKRLRSLKRGRYAAQTWERKIGEDLAIEKLFGHTIEFLECSYSQYGESNCPVRKAKNRMVRALKRMSEEVRRCSKNKRTVSSNAIRQFSASTTHLYQTARKSDVSSQCDVQWEKIGLCAVVVFG